MQRKNMIERKQSPEQKGRTILRNILITVGIMGAATIVCLALQHFSEADTHVPLLFVLAVVWRGLQKDMFMGFCQRWLRWFWSTMCSPTRTLS